MRDLHVRRDRDGHDPVVGKQEERLEHEEEEPPKLGGRPDEVDQAVHDQRVERRLGQAARKGL